MRAVLAVILPAALLAAAGASLADARGAPRPAVAAAAKHATVKLRHGALGAYLVDRRGRTLYLFAKDRTRRSRCRGSCAQFWPPLIAHGRPRAGAGVRSSKLSTSRRRDGSRQVVYAGHPLYRFTLDHRAGQRNGEGIREFGARWYIVAPSGHRIRPTTAPGW